MSKFLDCLERISTNAPPPMGFGVARSQRPPGMALVGLVSANYAAGCGLVADLSPDAALLSGVKSPQSLKRLQKSLPSVPWGVRAETLTEEAAQEYQDRGCDLLAFSLQSTPVSALSSEDMARVLCLDSDVSERELRSIGPLPVDVLLVSAFTQNASWTLSDLATIAAISRRVDKYILVEVSQPPGKKDLEALRNTGVHGLVLDVASVSTESLKDLKAALLEMPRQQPGRRERYTALVPGSAFSIEQEQAREEPEEDDEDF